MKNPTGSIDMMSVIELKALIYDMSVGLQQTQKNIEIITAVLAKKISEEKVPNAKEIAKTK